MNTTTRATQEKIAFQGVQGAYSHQALKGLFPQGEPFPCLTFEEAFEAVETGQATYAVIPVENSTAGRVADVHMLLPQSTLHVVGEYYLPIEHALLMHPEADWEQITTVTSHVQALAQCRQHIQKWGKTPLIHGDTAGAAQEIATTKSQTTAAIASPLAAEIYGLRIVEKNVQDVPHNTTRFLVLAANPVAPKVNTPCKTAFMFEVRSIPAALYKALGGFATNGINLLKLESYVQGAHFSLAHFYAEIESHTDTPAAQNAFEELAFYSQSVRILGTFESTSRTENLSVSYTPSQ